MFRFPVETMKDNKENLSQLHKSLDNLINLDMPGPSGDLQIRIAKLHLKVIAAECQSLAKESSLKRFFLSKVYKEKIQGIRGAVTVQIEEFVFYSNVLIEKLVQAIGNIGTVDNVLTNELLARLTYIPARYNAENTPEKCMAGTRVAVIGQIVNLLTDLSNPTHRIVMPTGTAGSGKSTIAKSVACILAENGFLAASFFFSRDFADRKGIRDVPSTIAHLIGKLLPLQKPWVICLDALDECGQDRGQILLRWLSESIHKIPVNIQLFLTGRSDASSFFKFDGLKTHVDEIVLDNIDSNTVNQDIRELAQKPHEPHAAFGHCAKLQGFCRVPSMFFNLKFDFRTRLRAMPKSRMRLVRLLRKLFIHFYAEQSLDGSTWTSKDAWKIRSSDVDAITSRAAGLFVFAATAVHYVLGGLGQSSPQEAVDYLLQGAPLKHLHDLYQVIINEAIKLPDHDDLLSQKAHHRAT
ncbi:hypothetical protein DFH09DRAFT_1082601 [Mycena vulgaris]|nr:hypothetical protein DFH09DRAFT_1082601 [Mycena vulgaris]